MLLNILRDLACMLFIFAYAAIGAYFGELAAQRFVLATPAYALVSNRAGELKRAHANLSAAAARAAATGKARDAAKLARDLDGVSGELQQAKMAGTGLAGRATAARNLIPYASIWLLTAVFPSFVALTLPVPVPAPMSWLTHRGVDGDDARAVGAFFVWLVSSAAAARVIVPWALPPVVESADFSVTAVLADAMAAVPAPKAD